MSVAGPNIHTDVCMIPHPAKRAKGGEDAYFVSKDATAMGVADGVGSWSFHGVDPGLYSKSLMESVKREWDERNVRDLRHLIRTAHEDAKSITGSSTIVLLCYEQAEGKYRAANLGDSGLMIIRDGKVWFRSKEQLHSFNFPFQIGTGQNETANDAELFELEAKEGDTVILATDGLWDNLTDEEILRHVCDYLHTNSGHAEGNTLADRLALHAFSRASSPDEVSPFMKHAFLSGFVAAPNGGKMDDITVVVAHIGAPARAADDIAAKEPT